MHGQHETPLQEVRHFLILSKQLLGVNRQHVEYEYRRPMAQYLRFIFTWWHRDCSIFDSTDLRVLNPMHNLPVHRSPLAILLSSTQIAI